MVIIHMRAASIGTKWAAQNEVELYKSRMTYHWFSTEYLSVGLHLEVFTPDS